jgi:hypothetical protein
MKLEAALRGIAGTFVFASVALGHWVHPGFYLFAAFVGINLVQSAFSGWCPMISLLRALRVRE